MEPEVDVIIAVHDRARPVERAVGSVLDHNHAKLRVSVVCHGIATDLVAKRCNRYVEDTRLRFLSFADGARSAAGPFNAGLDAATARYTSVMGSDDELEAGAIDGWLEVSARDRADVVIARLRHAAGGFVATPPTRPWRNRRLDAVRDRLAYRSAPLGLVSRSRFGDLRFTTGVPTGEDVAYVNGLWFSGARISYAKTSPAYLVHDDADSRASSSQREVSADLAFLVRLLPSPDVSGLGEEEKRALAVKLWRVNIFGTIHNRSERPLSASEKHDLAGICERLFAFAPAAPRVLSIAERRLADAARTGDASDATLAELSRRRRAFGRPTSMVPRRPLALLAREAPLRMMTASAIQKL